MNVFSRDYNPYLSSQLRGVSQQKLADPFLLEFTWNMFCDTIKNLELWQQAH